MHLAVETSLRPEFTAALAHRLLTGASTNLISLHGQGRRRTLADLHTALSDGLHIFRMDMRTYKHDYQGFYNELRMQSGYPTMGGNQLTQLLDALEKTASPCLLILHNFDALHHSEAVQAGYNSHFMDTLNRISGRTGISLLCISECNHQFYLFAEDGPELPGSTLQAEAIQLPPLTREQIRAELLRRKIILAEDQLSALTSHLLRQESPYTEICELALKDKP